MTTKAKSTEFPKSSDGIKFEAYCRRLIRRLGSSDKGWCLASRWRDVPHVKERQLYAILSWHVNMEEGVWHRLGHELQIAMPMIQIEICRGTEYVSLSYFTDDENYVGPTRTRQLKRTIKLGALARRVQALALDCIPLALISSYSHIFMTRENDAKTDDDDDDDDTNTYKIFEGNDDFEVVVAANASDALDKLDPPDGADYGSPRETTWIEWRAVNVDDDDDHASRAFEIEPTEPSCERGKEHRWIDHGPANGFGGRFIYSERCDHCGLIKKTNTWNINQPGSQGHTTIEFITGHDDDD